MKSTLARLRIPQWAGEQPTWLVEKYPNRILEFDRTDRAVCGQEHRALLVAVSEAKKKNLCSWFRCDCRDDKSLEVMVRMREPLPYLAVMPGTSLEHDQDCALYHAPITSHVSEAIQKDEDGSLRVRLNFRVGEPPPEQEKSETLNEAPLRTRRVQRQLNRFGLDGMLRLLFKEAGLHRWRPYYKIQDRVTEADSWKPTYGRLLRTLENIDALGRRSGVLKAYTRVGMPGSLSGFKKDTVLVMVDVIQKVEPPKTEGRRNWKCYLAGWGEKYLIISPAQVVALLGQLRFHPDRAKKTMQEKLSICARPGEIWWGCLLVRVEEGENEKWYRVLDQGVIRTDQHGIPAESLDEIEMTQHLIKEGRAFSKPLFPGELKAVPGRRPDFILEDTATPCCIEVAGMADVYDYNDRDEERLEDYQKAGVNYQRWQRGMEWPKLDGVFQSMRSKKSGLSPGTAHATPCVVA